MIHYLREFKRYDERAVHSLLVVDSEGRFIAGINESNKGDYKNENWFTGAYNGDKGRVYVGDLKLEGETDVYLINIAVPVMDGGAAIGLLVIRYSVDKLLSVINSVRIEETGHANLVDSSGTIIMCPIFPLRSHSGEFRSHCNDLADPARVGRGQGRCPWRTRFHHRFCAGTLYHHIGKRLVRRQKVVYFYTAKP